ncbi:protein DDB_G0268328-like isoform X2 [Argopecten irradians]|uniref:protein DDB_G0268328-like isoform X2 n=1 Tax=Argopecten irradians TaxID=31199 RepID=UPI00371D293A
MNRTIVMVLLYGLLFVLLGHVDVCLAARAGGSSTRTGSITSQSNAAGFVGGPDTSRFMALPGSSEKSHVLQDSSEKPDVLSNTFNKPQVNSVTDDSVDGSARWNNAPDPLTKKPSLTLLPVEDLAKKIVLRSILQKENRKKPRGKSIDSSESDYTLPIYKLPYPVSTGCKPLTPPPEPELTDSSSDSETYSSSSVEDDVDSALSDPSQHFDYYSKDNHI